jgi:hypothetical protein
LYLLLKVERRKSGVEKSGIEAERGSTTEEDEALEDYEEAQEEATAWDVIVVD